MKNIIIPILCLLVSANTKISAAEIPAQPVSPSSDRNYISKKTYTSNNGDGYTTIEYFDGFGRVVQTIDKGFSPSGQDAVTINEYTRSPHLATDTRWLPAIMGSDGSFKGFSEVKVNAKNLHDDKNPYSIVRYEISPDNNVETKIRSGEEWKAKSDDYYYGLNGSEPWTPPFLDDSYGDVNSTYGGLSMAGGVSKINNYSITYGITIVEENISISGIYSETLTGRQHNYTVKYYFRDTAGRNYYDGSTANVSPGKYYWTAEYKFENLYLVDNDDLVLQVNANVGPATGSPTPLDEGSIVLSHSEAWDCMKISISKSGGFAYFNFNSDSSQGEFFVSRVIDEDGRENFLFKDKLQRDVLSRTVGDNGEYFDTYYVYDNMGNPVLVVPPELSLRMKDRTQVSENDADICRFGYLYTYDDYGRLVSKRLPGAELVHMVYDKADRLVMTQDGNMREGDRWVYTVYDNLNRPVRQNIVKFPSALAREQIQAKFDAATYPAVYPATSSELWRLQKPFDDIATLRSELLSETRYGGYNYLSSDVISESLAYTPVFAAEGSSSGNVIITELMYDSPLNEQIATGAAYSNGEYIEFFNAGSTATDLTGWKLTGGGTTEIYNFPDGTTIPAKGYLIVAYQYNNSGFTLDQLYSGIDASKVLYQRKIILSNSGETVSVIDAQGNIVDAIFYDGTSNKTKPDRLSATNADDTPGMGCVSLHRSSASYDASGFAVASNPDWITTAVSPFSVPDMAALSVPASGGDLCDERTTGLKTYERIAVLDGEAITDQFIERAYYYDYKGRVIQTVERNHLGGMSRYSTKYDFVGNVLAAHESHQTAGGAVADVKLTEFTYDHRARLLSETTTLNGTAPALIDYGYDELGRLATKTSGTGADAIAETYDYNIQGWLTEKKSDYFDMRLRYHDPQKPGTEASYTGNITEWEWKHKGRNEIDSTLYAYAFSYDKLNRLTDSRKYEGVSFEDSFVERGLTYDRNGNILTLQRYGATAGIIDDDFSYGYTGNQLTGLDTAGATLIFAYDANGNCTTDGLNSLNLQYNYLDLTGKVLAGNQTVAEYRWLADGTKAGIKGYDDGTLSGGFEYLGSLIYRRDAGGGLQLESTGFGGGRIVASERASGTVYTPNYFITDHLGSTRAIVSHSGEVLDRSDYYPYGLKWEHPGAQASGNRWLYNGNELQTAGLPDGSNYLDYRVRILLPRLGRWVSPDPAQQYHSGYVYCGNNPILRLDPTGRWDITVHAYHNRAKHGYGVLVLADRSGNEVYRAKVRVEGSAKKSDDRRIRTNKYADTPTGTSKIRGWETRSNRRSYGPNHILALDYIDGEAAELRSDMHIHGGRQEDYINGEWVSHDDPVLVNTEGCIRMYDTDIANMKTLTEALEFTDPEEKAGYVYVRNSLRKKGVTGRYAYPVSYTFPGRMQERDDDVEEDENVWATIWGLYNAWLNLKRWFKTTLRYDYLCKLLLDNEKQIHKSYAHF